MAVEITITCNRCKERERIELDELDWNDLFKSPQARERDVVLFFDKHGYTWRNRGLLCRKCEDLLSELRTELGEYRMQRLDEFWGIDVNQESR